MVCDSRLAAAGRPAVTVSAAAHDQDQEDDPAAVVVSAAIAAEEAAIIAAAAKQQQNNDPIVVLSGTSHRESPLSNDDFVGEKFPSILQDITIAFPVFQLFYKKNYISCPKIEFHTKNT